MEADRLIRGITEPILKLGSRQMIVVTVCPGHFTAREKAVVFIELEAEWALGACLDVLVVILVSCFCQDLNPRFPLYVLVIVLTMLLHTGLKMMHKFVLIK